ncbi:MAG TPA: pantoate--beta-alanine ligase [Planctomycetota bacterium]|nr:pantoate--beta-alanine ligase [Planctomycetota bacterium]
MRTLTSVAESARACRAAGRAGRLGLVPTMGAIHAGHVSLVARARAASDTVAVSIFVNPLQFHDAQDLARYPRTLEADSALLAAAGADLLLVLAAEDMYPPGFATRVSQRAELTGVYEGAARPGHFDGVLTVVCKLFGISGPCRAYFGRKDFQQTVVVRRLVADLALDVELVTCDTLREADGLALSSRNVFLGPQDRARGLSLVAALSAVEACFERGERDAAALLAAGAPALSALPGAPDYFDIADPADLSPRRQARTGDVVLLAARVGPVRLIDNHLLGARLGPFSPGP